MWDVLIEHFRRYPAQERVVRLMIRHGFSINEDGTKLQAGSVDLADVAVARAADVDRRIVRATVEAIAAHPELRDVFLRMRPAMDLKEVAPRLDCGVIEIIPEDPQEPGILAGVSAVITRAGLSIRQAIGEDPDFVDEAKLVVITSGRLPGSMYAALQSVPGVKGVAVY